MEVSLTDDQLDKYEEICELLLGFGYFRIRIKSLTPFNKILGGIVWCLSLADFDVDINLHYEDSIKIGKKIALTEKIVTVLNIIKCPVIINPHQIQGLDFSVIFPLVQWLVKKVSEVRHTMTDYWTSLSLKYLKSHLLSEEEVPQLSKPLISKKIKRKYMKPTEFYGNAPIDTKIITTIYEYNDDQIVYYEQSSNKNSLPLHETLRAVESNKKNISIKVIGTLIDAIDISNINKLLEEEKDLTDSEKIEIENRKYNNMIRKIDDINLKIANIQLEIDRNVKTFIENEHLLNKHKVILEEIQSKKVGIDESLKNFDEKKLQNMKNLVSSIESLKDRNKNYKQSIKLEMDQLVENIETLKMSHTDENDMIRLVEEINARIKEKKIRLSKFKSIAARKARKLHALNYDRQTNISKEELLNFQKRFNELAELVSYYQDETKKLVIIYNIVQDLSVFMEKKLKILNSIHDSYKKASDAKNLQAGFISQMSDYHILLLNSYERFECRFSDEKNKNDSLKATNLELKRLQKEFNQLAELLEKEVDKLGS